MSCVSWVRGAPPRSFIVGIMQSAASPGAKGEQQLSKRDASMSHLSSPIASRSPIEKIDGRGSIGWCIAATPEAATDWRTERDTGVNQRGLHRLHAKKRHEQRNPCKRAAGKLTQMEGEAGLTSNADG